MTTLQDNRTSKVHSSPAILLIQLQIARPVALPDIVCAQKSYLSTEPPPSISNRPTQILTIRKVIDQSDIALC